MATHEGPALAAPAPSPDEDAGDVLYRAAFEQAPVGLAHVDADGRLLRVNRRLCQLTGFRPEELVGRTFREFTHPADVPTQLQLHAEVLSGVRAGYTLEKRYLGRDGSVAWAYLAVGPVRGPDGAVRFLLHVVKDVTQQREADEARDQQLGREYALRLRAERLVERHGGELAAARDRLQHAERLAAVGQLSAGVAHEVNNPLSYVLSNLHYIEDEAGELAAQEGGSVRLVELRRCAAEAREGAERIARIVQDLRTVSQAGREPPRPQRLADALDLAVTLAAPTLRGRAQLVLEGTDAPHTVLAAHGELGQVFLQLLLNAGQATPEGDPTRQPVHLRVRPGALGEVVVEVQDHGVGIPANVLPHLFEPYFTTRPGQGRGLGLALCHGTVQRLGGRLEVESMLGVGSTFRVVLPEAPADAPVPRALGAASQRCRVLIVDDEPLVARALARLLPAECEVHTRTSGREALTLLAHDPHFDVVFCDMLMADTTGMDVHAELARTQPTLLERLVLMTGGAFTPRMREFLATVPATCISKPFDVDQVRGLVAQRRAARAQGGP